MTRSKIIFSCYIRRDSNILLPKTPSMKRKRLESDEEQSSDDTAFKAERGAKAHKIQGYSSPLMVINENKLLNCSVTNEEAKLDGGKRTMRASRATSQLKRQQPRRGPRKKNLPDVGSSAEDQTSDSSSMDDKPKWNTGNSRKKNSELARVIEENGSDSSSAIVDEVDSSKRVTRNTRKKPKQETVEVSSTKELPKKPAKKKNNSNVATILKGCGEIMASVAREQEPASPFNKIPKRKTTRSSRNEEDSIDSETKETENRAHVLETPEPVVENVMSSSKSAKTWKATVNLVLQSPGLTEASSNRAASETTSSPHTVQDLGLHEITVEENDACPEQETNKDVIRVSSSTPILPQECTESHAPTESKNEEELENGEVENMASNEQDPDAIDGNADVSKGGVDEENTKVADPKVKSGRKSMQRNSGWRRKSKRSSRCLISPVNKRLSINRTVTKSKTQGNLSMIKSSVKLKLTQSKLMPELKINTADKCRDDRSPDPTCSLADVRVCLFDNLTSESSTSGASSATTSSSSSSSDDKEEAPSSSSCSSAEDKPEAPVERIKEEPAEEDSEEVFHDCRGSENEADNETEDAKCTKTYRFVLHVYTTTVPV